MTAIIPTPSAAIGGIVSNAFGEHYLFDINRNLFQGTDASTVFRKLFNESFFKEDTFYVIAGTDSGLLCQYVKKQGIPKGSRYLFVELPQILAQLNDMNDPAGKLVVTTDENWLDRAKEMDLVSYALLDQMTLWQSMGVIHGHYADYHPFWAKLKEQYDTFTWDLGNRTNYRPFITAQLTNLAENQIPAIWLVDKFKGKTAVLLAGGPSLDDILPWVRKHRENLLVIAVSIISGPLRTAGIQPDIITSVDPHGVNLYLSRDMFAFKDGSLFVYNNHLAPNLLSSWSGLKSYTGSRYPWLTPLEPENLPLSGGTTVTNGSFALAVQAGVSQLVLGGVDFCFSQEGHTYASGSKEYKMGTMPRMSEQEVETNNGMMADTLNAYHRSGLSIDAQAKSAVEYGCRVLNPAPGAMRLPHVEHLSLDEIQIEALHQPAWDIIKNAMPPSKSEHLINHYKEVLSEVKRILKELKTIKDLSGNALVYSRKLFSKGEAATGLHNRDKIAKIEKQFGSKYKETTNLIKHFGVKRFAPMLLLENQGRKELEKNNQVYFQAFVDSSEELIEVLRQSRDRIISRLEEEKANPNVQLLIDQWQLDNHSGRAIQWIEGHKDIVDKLPEEQQEKLHAFYASFEDTLEKFGEVYERGRRINSGLEGTAGKIQSLFQNRKIDGLQRLLTSLKGYAVKEEAVSLIALVKGHLAELCDDLPAAIEAYQGIEGGTGHFEALMRLFHLHTKARNIDAAVDVLKTLSDINPMYSAMYADMLYATGDVDNAVAIYTDYLLANPDDLDTMMKLGKLFHECGSIDGVTWTMNYILGKDPNNYTARQILNEAKLTG